MALPVFNHVDALAGSACTIILVDTANSHAIVLFTLIVFAIMVRLSFSLAVPRRLNSLFKFTGSLVTRCFSGVQHKKGDVSPHPLSYLPGANAQSCY